MFPAVSLGNTNGLFSSLSLHRNQTFIKWLSKPPLDSSSLFLMVFPLHIQSCLSVSSWKTQTNTVAYEPKHSSMSWVLVDAYRTERVDLFDINLVSIYSERFCCISEPAKASKWTMTGRWWTQTWG